MKDKTFKNFKLFVYSILVLFIIVALFAPKIYIRNEIYYLSRDIVKLEQEYEILKHENKTLRLQVEKERFKSHKDSII